LLFRDIERLSWRSVLSFRMAVPDSLAQIRHSGSPDVDELVARRPPGAIDFGSPWSSDERGREIGRHAVVENPPSSPAQAQCSVRLEVRLPTNCESADPSPPVTN
jgi:hypothetical protein